VGFELALPLGWSDGLVDDEVLGGGRKRSVSRQDASKSYQRPLSRSLALSMDLLDLTSTLPDSLSAQTFQSPANPTWFDIFSDVLPYGPTNTILDASGNDDAGRFISS
jgi:hypothetical protein